MNPFFILMTLEHGSQNPVDPAPRRENRESLLTPDKVIEAQIANLKSTIVSGLNLPFIKVQDTPEERNSSFWNDRLTLGLLGNIDETVAILVSSQTEDDEFKIPVDALLITPGSLQGSLLRDESSGQPAANFFFSIENGQVIPIIPSSPVPIDLLIPNWTS